MSEPNSLTQGVRSSPSHNSEFGDLPTDWTLERVANVSSMITVGFVGSMAHLFQRSGVPLLRGQDVSPNRLDTTQPRYISPTVHALWKKSALRAGDVVLVRVGYPGTAAVVPEGLGDVNAASLVIVRPSQSKIRSDFLSIFVNSDIGKKQIEGLLVGGAQQVLNTSTAAQLTVPLPPMLEQEAIAEALSNANALIESLESLIAKKRAIKQGAMQELLSGQRRLPSFKGVWDRRKLAEVCTKIQDGTHFSPKLGGTDYFYVTSKNIRRGTLDLSSVETISAEEHAKIYARCDTRKGDLLLTKDGASTGNAAINSIDEPISLLSSVAMLRFDPAQHCAEFFLQMILSEKGQNQITNLMSGNAITRLTLAKIRAFEIDAPSLPEQQAIAQVLSDMDHELAELGERLAKAGQIKQGMMQELLTGRVRLV